MLGEFAIFHPPSYYAQCAGSGRLNGLLTRFMVRITCILGLLADSHPHLHS